MKLQICLKNFDKANRLLERRPQNDIELHVEENTIKGRLLVNDYSLFTLGAFKSEILEEIKDAKYNVLEDMV